MLDPLKPSSNAGRLGNKVGENELPIVEIKAKMKVPAER
jgi:hypothetical protein